MNKQAIYLSLDNNMISAVTNHHIYLSYVVIKRYAFHHVNLPSLVLKGVVEAAPGPQENRKVYIGIKIT